MRSEDITPLLDPTRGPDAMSYAQGTVVVWDQATGRNKVSVAGTELQDLPILNTGEAIALQVGHVVGLTRWRSQWFILGRITIPGSGQFASSAVAFDTTWRYTTGFGVPSALTLVATATLQVPPWATSALVVASSAFSVKNPSTAVSYFGHSLKYGYGSGREGFNSGEWTGDVQAGGYGQFSISTNDVMDVADESSINVKAYASTGGVGGLPVDSANACLVNISATFKSGV